MVIKLIAYDELIDYLSEKATPEEVLSFQPSKKAQARATELLNKNNDGTITDSERFELELLRQYDMTLAKLKLKAEIALRDA